MQTAISIVFWVMVVGSAGYEVLYLIQRKRFKKWLKEHPPETWPHPELNAGSEEGQVSPEGLGSAGVSSEEPGEDEFL